jgi:NADP-dependent aldehyde dehydrogenase
MTAVQSIDRRSGRPLETVADTTSDAMVDQLCRAAAATAPELERLGRGGRATTLQLLADALEDDRPGLVAVADRETALGPQRLNSELTRTCFQLRFFADVIEDGGYLEATIDHAGDTPMGARPDLRRMLVPLGPVAVFGASNFPFAFSVPGGDTASALAAGCPVVIKAHSAHPATSLRTLQALHAGLRAAAAPADAIALIFGQAAGATAVEHPAVRAVGFTGSVAGGRALHDLAANRPDPIPFYGELGALNAVVVTPRAAAERADAIAQGLAASFTLGVGQFCTKPGLAFLPGGANGDRIRTALIKDVSGRPAEVMLDDRVGDGYALGSETLRDHPGVTVLAAGEPAADSRIGTVQLLEAQLDSLTGAVLDECFGPVLVLVEYADERDLFAALDRLGPALTGTVHAAKDETNLGAALVDRFVRKVGRVVWNGYPTGVAVAWAMHHGGPYPATTNALHTSVGASAIRRWLRPVSYQDLPDELLPAELREANPEHLPRRVDGRMVG